MPHPVERLFTINKDVEDVLLVLTAFLTQNSDVEDLFRGASFTAKISLLFGCDLLCLWFQSNQDDFQHCFACMTNEADGSVALSCRFPLSGSVMMSDCVQGVGHSPVRQISLQILVVVSMSVTVSTPCFISSSGMLCIQCSYSCP